MWPVLLLTLLFGPLVALPSFNQGRIVGGKNAKRSDFPFIVSLQYKPAKNYKDYHVCGGSIISQSWVLTAAHCITELPFPGILNILAGVTDFKNKSGEEKWQKITVVKRIVHQDYKGGPTPNDIALLRLETPLELNKYVSPIRLPKRDDIAKGIVILAGWGSTVPDPLRPVLPFELQFAEVPIIDFETCDQILRVTPGNHVLGASNICTGPLSSGLSACVGDSGGPLVQTTKNGPVLYGITSWVFAPCGVGAPSVFTNIPSFLDWITEMVQHK